MKPNELEMAILKRMAITNGWLQPIIENLSLQNRDMTPCGSYTDFEPDSAVVNIPDGHIDLNALISVPGVPYGMSAALFVKDGHVTFLEIVANGGDNWDGKYEGFTISA